MCSGLLLSLVRGAVVRYINNMAKKQRKILTEFHERVKKFSEARRGPFVDEGIPIYLREGGMGLETILERLRGYSDSWLFPCPLAERSRAAKSVRIHGVDSLVRRCAPHASYSSLRSSCFVGFASSDLFAPRSQYSRCTCTRTPLLLRGSGRR